VTAVVGNEACRVPCARNLVCLHGFMGNAADWDPLRELLPDVELLPLELPGHGVREVDDAFTFESVAEDLLASMDAAGLERPHLLGYSLGGRLALYLACRHPDRFASLILESASPGLDGGEEQRLRCMVDDARAETLRSIPLKTFLEDWYRQPLFASLDHRSDLREELVERRLKNNPSALAQAISSLSPGRQPSLWSDLEKVSCPVLLIAGELDRKYTSLAMAMEEALPMAELSLVDGAGHCVHAEHPYEMAHRIQRFLKG